MNLCYLKVSCDLLRDIARYCATDRVTFLIAFNLYCACAAIICCWTKSEFLGVKVFKKGEIF